MKARLRSVCVFFSLFVFLVLGASAVFAQQHGGVLTPEVGRSLKFDISPPLRSIKAIGTRAATKADEDSEGGPPDAIHRHEPDPTVQTTTGSGVFDQANLI